MYDTICRNEIRNQDTRIVDEESNAANFANSDIVVWSWARSVSDVLGCLHLLKRNGFISPVRTEERRKF